METYLQGGRTIESFTSTDPESRIYQHLAIVSELFKYIRKRVKKKCVCKYGFSMNTKPRILLVMLQIIKKLRNNIEESACCLRFYIKVCSHGRKAINSQDTHRMEKKTSYD